MANKIIGTKGDDVLKGTKKKDIIKGKGGDDIIKGKGGNDVLKGGKGKDELKGGGGNDDLKGGSGKDLLFGGKGSDDHWGGKGADIFKFKPGDGFFDGDTNSYEDIVWDFLDGVDKFDVPVPIEDPVTGIIGGGEYNDPVGGFGTYAEIGEGGVITGTWFAVGWTGAQFSGDDFI